MKIGSLCTGYGGLDMAVEAYFNAETIWCAEFDKYASQLIEHRLGLTNYGDIKKINWAELEPIDILTAGYPCQPFSHAGDRKGTTDDRHIFPFILEAISILRPRWVVLENVRGHLSLGFKEVLASLASIGYDAKWQVVRASEVGAPHQRARLFIIAYPKSEGSSRQANEISGQISKSRGDISTITYSNDTRRIRSMQGLQGRFNSCSEMSLQTPADALDHEGKLNPKFVEYMMGLPVGWVTDIDISRAQQLKMLGNGVVPQQAYYALQQLLDSDTPSEQDF